MPGEGEYRAARKTLKQVGWDMDYIVPHCCLGSVHNTFSEELYQRDALTDFLDGVLERCQFQCFGALS